MARGTALLNQVRQLVLGNPTIPLFGLALAACLVFLIVARIPFFWAQQLWGKVSLAALGGMLLMPLVIVLLRDAWGKLTSTGGRRTWIWLAACVFIGAALGSWWTSTGKIPQVLHRMEIETPQDPQGLSSVYIMELRDSRGQVVPPTMLVTLGPWRAAGSGYILEGGQPGKIYYSFMAPPQVKVEIVLRQQPAAGQVVLHYDGQQQLVNLKNEVKENRVVSLQLQSNINRVLVTQVASWVLLLTLLPLVLFVVTYPLQIQSPTARSLADRLPGSRERFFMIGFLLLLALPLIGVKDFSAIEKTFWGREFLLRTYSNFRLYALGDRIFNSVIAGKDNWLMYTGEISLDDYQNTMPFSEAQLSLIQRKLDGLEARLNAQGIEMLVVVPPNKNTIYPEYFPPQIPVMGEKSRLDQLVEYQAEHGQAQILDLRPAFMEARQEQQIYYATDTHWNPYGALLAYQEIIRALQPAFPELQPRQLADFEYVSQGMRAGDMGVKLGQITVEEHYFDLKPKYKPQFTSRSFADRNGVNIVHSYHPDQSLPRLFMYRDSFSSTLFPLLADHFSKGVYVWTFHVDEEMITAEQPDVVIIECTERYLTVLQNLPEP